MTVLIIALVLVAVVAFSYNGLVSLRNKAENGWAQIDTQLQRRHDLIPNLVETVKGYANHESQVFERVTQARASMAQAGTVGEKAEASGAVSEALKSLFAVAEAYPDLKASENFKSLQVELTGTENKISFARQYYNDTVTRLNTEIQMFPSNIIAKMFNFNEMEYFNVTEESVREVPKVQF